MTGDMEMKSATASEIAAAMLRFCEEAAYPDRTGPPEGWPRTAEPCYIFKYSNKRVLRDEVAQYLESLEGPILLCPTLTSRTVLLTRMKDLTGEDLAGARRQFEAQTGMLEAAREMVVPLKDDNRILLEFDGESLVFTTSTLLEWAARYHVTLGWTISPLKDDPRAHHSMDMWRIDGHTSTHFRQEL